MNNFPQHSNPGKLYEDNTLTGQLIEKNAVDRSIRLLNCWRAYLSEIPPLILHVTKASHRPVMLVRRHVAVAIT